MASSLICTRNAETKTYTWVIANFSTLNTQRRSSDFFTTEDQNFTLDLTINPKEISSRTSLENHLSIYLIIRSRTYCSDELKVHYTLSLLDESGAKCNTKEGNAKIRNEKIESNWQYTISRDYVMDKANGLLIDDTLKVHCVFYVIDNMKATNSLEIPQVKQSSITHDLLDLFESKKYCDVIVMAGEKRFPCHKLILSSRSPVFAAMFEHDCEESKQNRVEITDIDEDTVEQLLLYMYTDRVDKLDQYSSELMLAADKYQMSALKSICEQYLSSSLTIESSFHILLLSDRHSAQQLKANCLEYITKHCKQVNTDQWNELITTAPHLSFALFERVANYAMNNHK